MKDRVWAWVIGTALLLFAIHSPLLTLTDSKGITWIFLPSIGMFTALFITFVYLMQNYRVITLGQKYIWLPLAVIVASIILADLWQFIQGDKTSMEALATVLFALFLFELYLVARILGDELFRPFMYAVIIVAISAIPYGILLHSKTGGLASPTNYDMGAGLLIFGTLVASLKRRWWLSCFTIIGLYFMGAEEGYFALVVLLAVILFRRDYSWRIVIPLGVAGAGILFLAGVGHYDTVIDPTIYKINRLAIAAELDGIEREQALDEATGYRYATHWRISPIKPFGYGYSINQFYHGIPHNVVLIIIEQVGIMAAIAWLFVMIYCLVKTKWKYAFIGVLSLSIFDHYLWTQVAPWTWALVGVASVSNIKSDLIYKEVQSG